MRKLGASRPRLRLGSSDRAASKQVGRPVMLAVGFLGILLTVLMVAIAFNAPNSIPGRSYYTLEAEFEDADNITPHSQVRLGGKLVGQILDPRVDDGKAVADLQIDPEYGPLRSDTKVEIRPRSAVGVRYVDVTPGLRGRELEDGERLPVSQTKATTPLDEVLATFDERTKRGTQRMLRGLGGGLAGRGDELNEAISASAEMFRGTDEVLSAINDRPGATSGFIRGAASAASAADPVRRALGEGFEPEAKALRPFSDRADSLRSTLEQAPSTLATASSRLPAFDTLATQLQGFARNLRPGLEVAPQAFRDTSSMLRVAGPSLEDAEDTVRLAGRAVNPTLGLLRTVRPLLPRLDTTFLEGAPVVDRLGAHGCDLVRWGTNWSSMMSYGNSSGGGVLRFNLVTPTAESFMGAGEGLEDSPLYASYENAYPGPCRAGSERLGD